MGKTSRHDRNQKKHAFHAKPKITPFRFLDMSPEIRAVVYKHYFGSVTIIIDDDLKEYTGNMGFEDFHEFPTRAT